MIDWQKRKEQHLSKTLKNESEGNTLVPQIYRNI